MLSMITQDWNFSTNSVHISGVMLNMDKLLALDKQIMYTGCKFFIHSCLVDMEVQEAVDITTRDIKHFTTY